METILKLVGIIAVSWIFILLSRFVEKRSLVWTEHTAGKVDDILIPFLARLARFLVPAMAVILALPLMEIPVRHEGIVRKVTGIFIIGSIAWMLWKTVKVGEAIILRYCVQDPKDDLRARTVLTQVQVIRKVLMVLIVVFSVASMLMLFEEVRELGSSILASAGVLGVIIGFAAQRTIANLFAGFQIAITQPIRLGDSVRVEGEFGSIEEITLTYVVLKTWDWKRLILPINHFIEKPFQNWTRTTGSIMGTAFVYVDYTAPIEAIRAEFKRIVDASAHWDKNVAVMHVTELTDRTVQIRLLMSSSSSALSFELRCEVRERLLAFLREQHPASLPQTRLQTSLPGGKPPNLGPGHESHAVEFTDSAVNL